ncbi:ABC1 kinase family protein [Desulfolucanica intricata]|uniref:ABC1 kinase family protein n=1 Tax=Desulfolucanica intricata TaxID=1285191 RepID=UPI000AC57186|nr:AarF/UbiB family protein [Desulfolucanica intricata]
MHLRLRRRYKHFKRYREIANVLAKHGFGYLLHQLGLGGFINIPKRILLKVQKEKDSLSPARRLRLVLEELGPTFIKLGQVLSTRSDLLAPEFIKELEKLLDEVPPFPYEQVEKCIETELGQPLKHIYSYFEETPLAAASIGQVHRAVLQSGDEVVVKVQRPGIKKIIKTDIEILQDLAALVDRHTPWGELYSFTEMAAEFKEIIRDELDYTVEAHHAETLRKNMQEDDTVYIPSVYWDYSTELILTLEYVQAVKLTRTEDLHENNLDTVKLAGRLADAVLKQILIDGFFHADPHPGNLAALPGEKIVFMDFGMMGQINEELKNKIIRLVQGLINKNTREIVKAIISLEVVPAHVNMLHLERDVERLRRKYYEIPLSRISLADSLGEIMGIAFKYRIRVPTEFTLLVKTLITVEGITQQLDPNLSIIGIAEPFGRRLMAERLSYKNLKKVLWEGYGEYKSLYQRIPRQTAAVLERAVRGELRIKAENPDLERIMSLLNILINRLVFSIVVAALIIGSSLLTRKEYSLFRSIPVAELGFLAAGTIGFWLLISIIRSRRF